MPPTHSTPTPQATAARNTRKHKGSVTVLTLLALLIAVAGFTALGMAQMMWQKREIQKIADLSASVAAAQLGDGPQFTEAYQNAAINGAKTGEVLIDCRNTAGAPTSCATASAARATVTRTLQPYFFSSPRTIVATASARPSPLVIGNISSGLVSLNSQQSALLNAIVSAIGGGNVSLDAVSWQELVMANAQVNLLDLAVGLNAASARDLANLDVNLANLLNISAGVAKGSSADLARVSVNQLGGALKGTSINLGSILKADLSQREAAQANVALGDLVLAAILAGTDGRAVNLGMNTGGLGISVKLYVVEPPQLIFGRKKEGAPFVAYGRTAQVKLEINSKGLSVPVGIPGLASANLSGLNLSVYVQAGGAQATVKDIQCKMPRSENQTRVNLSSSLVNVCVGGAPSRFADDNTAPIQCGTPANIANLKLNVLLIPITLAVSANAQTSAQSDTADVTLTGKAPLTYQQMWRANNGLSSILKTLNLNLNVDASLAGLNLGGLVSSTLEGLLDTVLPAVASILSPVLDTVGGVLDSLLSLLGISLVNSTLNLNTLDCSATVLSQ